MARSFKTYVVGNYEDEIYDAIDDYLQEHPEELAKKCSSLHQMGDVNLDSIEIMMVYCCCSPFLSLPCPRHLPKTAPMFCRITA